MKQTRSLWTASSLAHEISLLLHSMDFLILMTLKGTILLVCSLSVHFKARMLWQICSIQMNSGFVLHGHTCRKHGWVNHCTSCWRQAFCLEIILIQTWKACLEWCLCNNVNNVWSVITFLVWMHTLHSKAAEMCPFFNNWSYLSFLGDSDPNLYYSWYLKVNLLTFTLLKYHGEKKKNPTKQF